MKITDKNIEQHLRELEALSVSIEEFAERWEMNSADTVPQQYCITLWNRIEGCMKRFCYAAFGVVSPYVFEKHAAERR